MKTENLDPSRKPTNNRGGIAAIDRPLPADPYAERALLGSLLAKPDAVSIVQARLDANWFSLLKHQWIYEAILACASQEPPIVPDVHSVCSILRRYYENGDSRLVLVGGLSHLNDLIMDVAALGAPDGYARFVMDTAIRRQLIETSGKIAVCGYDETLTLEETLVKAEEMLSAVTSVREMDGVVKLGDLMSSIFNEECRRRDEGDNQTSIVPTPFYDLNSYLGGGLRRGELTIVAARPGVGKTAFAQTVALDIARNKHPVLFFSLEMSRTKMAYRFLSMQTGLSAQELQAGRWLNNEQQLGQVIESMGQLSNLAFYLDDHTEQPVSAVRARARQIQKQTGQLGLVVVDYLQLLQYMVGKRRMDFRVNEVTEVVQALKAMAQQLEVPVLALAQLNRSVEGRVKRVPVLSDLRESGGIEQAADQVLLLYREELYNKETSKKGVVEVHVAKNRDGRLGMIPLVFRDETTTFLNLATNS